MLKGMRWSTALAVVQSGIEAHIEARNQEASRGRELLYLLGRISPPEKMGGGDSDIAPSKSTGKRPAAGTIPDRVLAIVGESGGEPMSLTAILSAKHGAKDSHVRTAIRQLVKSGHLVATGATLSRRFSLPAKGKR